MINITNTQTLFLIAYTLLFAFLLALIACYQKDYPRKNYHELIPHFGLFIIVLVLFLAGAYGVLSLFNHLHAAACLLITLKYDHKREDYWMTQTEMLSQEDAEKVRKFFDSHQRQVEKILSIQFDRR